MTQRGATKKSVRIKDDGDSLYEDSRRAVSRRSKQSRGSFESGSNFGMTLKSEIGRVN